MRYRGWRIDALGREEEELMLWGGEMKNDAVDLMLFISIETVMKGMRCRVER